MNGPSRRKQLVLIFLVLVAADLVLLAPALFRADLVRAPGDQIAASMPYARESADLPPKAANPYLSDWSYSIHSWQVLVGDALREGRLPLWNERAGCGQPLIGNIQAEIFSPYQPLNVLAADQYVDWKQLAQLLAAQLACLFLAGVLGLSAPAALIIALGYSFGSYMQAWMVHPVAGSAAFAPAIVASFILLRRAFSYRRLAGAGLLIGLSILGGHVESTFMACFAASALGFLMAREGEKGASALFGRLRFAGLALAAGGLGVALAAATLLPFFDYYDQSLVATIRLAQPARSVPLEHLLVLLDAKALGFPVDEGGFRGFENYITTTLHVGRGLLVLAILGLTLGLARRSRGVLPMAFIAASGIALAVLPPAAQDLLDFFPVNLMPLLRIHYLAALLLPVMAGIGLDKLLESGRAWAIGTALLASVLGGLGPALVALLPELAYAPRFDPLGIGLFVLAGLALATASILRARPAGRVALAVFCALAIGEALLLWRPFVPTVATTTLHPRSSLLDRLEEREVPGRLLPVVPNLPPETGNLHRIQSLRHYDGMGLTRLTALLYQVGAYQGVTTDAPIVHAPRGILDALGLRWTLTDFDPERAVGRYGESFVTAGAETSRDFVSLSGAEIEFLVFRADRGPVPAGALSFEVNDEEGRSIRHSFLEPDAELAEDPELGRFHRDRDPALAAYIRRAEGIQGGPHHHVAYRMATTGSRSTIRLRVADDAPEMVVQVLARAALDSVSRFEHRGLHLGERASALPMLHVSARQLVVENLETAITTMAQPGFDPSAATVLECRPEFLSEVQPRETTEAIDFDRPRPDEIRFRTDFARPSVVVFGEVLARGWEARAGGKLLEMAPANVAAMAIRVPAGSREIVLRYRPTSLAWGLLLSGLALLLVLASPIADRWRAGRNSERRGDAVRSGTEESPDAD